MADITLSLSKLEAIIARAITVGRVETMSQYLPQGDWISRPSLISYLKVIGKGASLLKHWEDAGLIHSVQSGVGGTRKYSRLEIQKLLLQLEITEG